MTYTATVTVKGQVTIPKPIREFLDLTDSRKVAFVKTNERVEVKPVVDFMSLKGSVSGKKYSDKKADQAVAKHIADEYGQE